MGSIEDAPPEVTTEPTPVQERKRRSFIRRVSLRLKQTLSLEDKSEETDKPVIRRHSESVIKVSHPVLRDRNVLVKSLAGRVLYKFPIEKNGLTGQELMDRFKFRYCLKHSEYFGFRIAKSSDDHEDLRNPWLNMSGSIRSQVRKVKITSFESKDYDDPLESQSAKPPEDITLFLKIRYYPCLFEHIQEVFLCDYLFLQLGQDLERGKLIGSEIELAWLMAHILQFRFGDWKHDLIIDLAEMNILPDQDLYERQATEYWRIETSGLSPYQVQMQFIRSACNLETYGINYHRVKDLSSNLHTLIGFNYEGVKTFRNDIHVPYRVPWTSILKIDYIDSERGMRLHFIANNNPAGPLYFTCFTKVDYEDLCSESLDQRRFFNAMLQRLNISARPLRPQIKVLPPVEVSPSDEQNSQRVYHLAAQPCQASPIPCQQDVSTSTVELSDNTDEQEVVASSVSKIEQSSETAPQKANNNVSRESLTHQALELGSSVLIKENQSGTIPTGEATDQPNLSETEVPSDADGSRQNIENYRLREICLNSFALALEVILVSAAIRLIVWIWKIMFDRR